MKSHIVWIITDATGKAVRWYDADKLSQQHNNM